MRKSRTLSDVGPLSELDELEVGRAYVVKRFNGTQDERFIATLIETKIVSDEVLDKHRNEKKTNGENGEEKMEVEEEKGETKEEGKAEGEGSSKEHNGHNKLFYIHYEGLDRRADEWVERERFVEKAPPAALCSPAILPSGVENATQGSGTMTRSQKRIHVEFHHQQQSYDDMDATTAKLEKEHEERTKVKNVDTILFGRFEISTWYFSPYPKIFDAKQKLFICEYCLLYVRTKEEIQKHLSSCTSRAPPGELIYLHKGVAVYEVDGRSNKVYCQCLCLLSKLFLDHKTLYFDVDTFIFYVICEVVKGNVHLIGHFSKEINSENNLACIMVLPPYQRNGYGKLLIQLSYELSSREGWIGTPEKPLSDLGKVSYRSYWWYRLLEVMDQMKVEDITVSDLSELSGIAPDDIITTLQTMNMVKYWKGEHVVRSSRRMVEHCRALGMCKAPRRRLYPPALKWQPRHPRGSPRTHSFD